MNLFNPFPPSMSIWHHLAKLSILILEGITKKISYERRDYESVDENWANFTLCLEKQRKKESRR